MWHLTLYLVSIHPFWLGIRKTQLSNFWSVGSSCFISSIIIQSFWTSLHRNNHLSGTYKKFNLKLLTLSGHWKISPLARVFCHLSLSFLNKSKPHLFYNTICGLLFSKSGHRKIVARCQVGCKMFLKLAEWAMEKFPVKTCLNQIHPLVINNNRSPINNYLPAKGKFPVWGGG